MSIEKEFVPYQESLELKELGFDEQCFSFYDREGKLYESEGYYKRGDNVYEHEVIAPTFSQAFRFFREKYDWQHSIDPTADQHSHQLGYNYWIWNYKTGEEHHTMPKNRPTGDWEYETYEEAELECIIRLIDIVKKQNLKE